MKVIEVKNLEKTFKVKVKDKGLKGSLKAIVKPKYEKVKAVRGVSFDVEEGEIIAFIGPNGAGKLITSNNEYEIKYGDSFIIPANLGKFTLSGDLEVLKSYI